MFFSSVTMINIISKYTSYDLAVMGENLALNMESKGWYVSVYNRTVPGVEEGVVDRFMNSRAKGKNIEGFTDIKAFVDSIATPRKIMMMAVSYTHLTLPTIYSV